MERKKKRESDKMQRRERKRNREGTEHTDIVAVAVVEGEFFGRIIVVVV